MSENGRERMLRIWRESEWDDVATFLGRNADRFRPAWEKTRDKASAGRPGIAWTWCWPALFFGFAWFLYRKQWIIGSILLILPLAVGYFIELPGGATVGIGIAVASMAKWLVLQDAVSRIAKIRGAGGGAAEIARSGGVSLVGAIIGGAITALGLALIVIWVVVEGAGAP